jgi:hypothetical protein
MSEFLTKLFSSDFMPHGACYLWKPEIVWLHALSDGLISTILLCDTAVSYLYSCVSAKTFRSIGYS